MQFIVPQFIDVESKILGPITPKQFIILIIMTGLIFLCYKLADFTLFLIEAVVIFGMGMVIAFVKVNGQPVYYFFLSLLTLIKNPSLRVWRKGVILLEKEINLKDKIKEEKTVIRHKPLSSSKLSQVALLVDTGGEYQD